MNRPPCRKCNETKTVKLRRQIMQSGGTQVFWYCTSCEKKAESKFITLVEANQILRPYGKTSDDLEITDDYRVGVVCKICGAIGAEYHHWLPQCFADLVNDHSAWPGDYLCKPCHDKWHEIVTPYLPGRGSSELAAHTIAKYLTQERNNGHVPN